MLIVVRLSILMVRERNASDAFTMAILMFSYYCLPGFLSLTALIWSSEVGTTRQRQSGIYIGVSLQALVGMWCILAATLSAR